MKIVSYMMIMVVVFMGSGCLSSRKNMTELRTKNVNGDFVGGIGVAYQWLDKTNGVDMILAGMSLGQMELNARRYEQAQTTFEWTERKWKDVWNTPDRDEGVAGTTVRKTVQTTLPPYSAHAHEGIMIYTYLGLASHLAGE